LCYLCADFKQVLSALTKKQFHRRVLDVEQVPISSTIIVSSLPTERPVTEDTLFHYFENKRSGGSDVEDVELIPDAQCALVTFADYQGDVVKIEVNLCVCVSVKRCWWVLCLLEMFVCFIF
jgi:hypothetical protein